MGINKIKRWFVVLPVAWMVVIFLFSHQPGNESAELSGSITVFIARIISGFGFQIEKEAAHNIIRSLAHFLIFFVLGTLWCFSFRINGVKSMKAAVISTIIGVAYAVVDEIHQSFIPGRACDIKDVFIDTVGVLLAVSLGQGVRFLVPDDSRD